MEFIFEIVLEIIFELIGALISKYADFLDKNKEARKYSKYIMILVFYAVSILIFVLSIIYKKQFLVNITLIYMLIQTVFNALRFINNNAIRNEKFSRLIKTIKVIFYYSYPILLIVTSSMWIDDVSTKAWIIVFSSLAILIRFIIDMIIREKSNGKKEIENSVDKEVYNYWIEKKNEFFNKYNLPNDIKEFLEKGKFIKYEKMTEFSRSGDQVYNIDDKYILKISTKKERLIYEKNIYNKLDSYSYFPKTLFFSICKEYTYYLRTNIKGKPLCSNEYLKNPELVVNLLCEAINILHSIKINEKKNNQSDVFVHGDCCLPNILIDDNKVVGFIDMNDAGYDDPWVDYSWALWSLEYNLKTNEYNKMLLDKLGIEMNEEKYIKYVQD